MKVLLLCLLMVAACEDAAEPLVLSPMPTFVPVVVTAKTEPKPPPLKVLAKYETKFKAGDRGYNIELLTKTLHDTVLEPGDEFRFNKAAGPRTLERGFREAPAYFVGEVIPTLGGGTCQVSSTLHAAALYAGLEITSRRPHSRPSKYIPAGLDAMVNYPESCVDPEKADPRVCSDLRFRNPFDFPIKLWFGAKSEGVDGSAVLRVHVVGKGPVPEVSTRWLASGRPEFKTRYRRVIYWKDERGHRKRLKQSGHPGLTGVLYIDMVHPDGKKETRRVASRYRPTIEVFNVGMDYEIPE